jgi:two-component system, response regulator PdtaR
MPNRLRIAIADDERDMRDYFARILPTLGHEIVVVAENGRELVDRCYATQPDLLIVDICMPEMDGLAALEELCSVRPLPAILVSAYTDQEFVRRAEENYVMAYLIKPVKLAELAPTIALAMRRFEQLQTLQHEARDLRQSLEERKVIERAKGVLAARLRIDEAEAFRHLQKLAMQSKQKMIDAAREILGGRR